MGKWYSQNLREECIPTKGTLKDNSLGLMIKSRSYKLSHCRISVNSSNKGTLFCKLLHCVSDSTLQKTIWQSKVLASGFGFQIFHTLCWRMPKLGTSKTQNYTQPPTLGGWIYCYHFLVISGRGAHQPKLSIPSRRIKWDIDTLMNHL